MCVCVCDIFTTATTRWSRLAITVSGCTNSYELFNCSIGAAKYETVESLISKEFNCTDVALLFFMDKY